MTRSRWPLASACFSTLIWWNPAIADEPKPQSKPDAAAHAPLRLIVETDAGGDPDDEQSLVRFLVYANEFDIEGIIANRPAARDGENHNVERTGLGIVRQLGRAYASCADRLREHDKRYPTGEQLLSRIVPGYDFVEDGVRLIIRAVDADDPRPVWFLNWGTDRGAAVSCLQRALDQVLRDRGPGGYARFKSRLRLSSSDEFEEHTARTMPAFPIWVDTFRPELERKRWYHRFSALTATAGGFDIERDVRRDHGPIGALYPTNTTHKQKEGDTMTFLYLVSTGMNDPDHPEWGSWAGRYELNPAHPGKRYYHATARDSWNGSVHRENTLGRWAADLQNDFRARMDWCVQPFDRANHPPMVRPSGPRRLRARPGETLALDASGSTDPDPDPNRDPLTFEWFVYREAGTSRAAIDLSRETAGRVALAIPSVDASGELHIVVRVSDRGEPPLARYGRWVITIP